MADPLRPVDPELPDPEDREPEDAAPVDPPLPNENPFEQYAVPPKPKTDFEKWQEDRDADPDRRKDDLELWAEGKYTRPRKGVVPTPMEAEKYREEFRDSVRAARPLVDEIPDPPLPDIGGTAAPGGVMREPSLPPASHAMPGGDQSAMLGKLDQIIELLRKISEKPGGFQ